MTILKQHLNTYCTCYNDRGYLAIIWNILIQQKLSTHSLYIDGILRVKEGHPSWFRAGIDLLGV